MTALRACQCGCGKPTEAATGYVRGHALAVTSAAVGRPDVADVVAAYAEQLLHASALIVGAVHDEGPVAVESALAGALAVPAPPGVDPVTALVTVLAAQIDVEAPASRRLGWVHTASDSRTSESLRAERGAA